MQGLPPHSPFKAHLTASKELQKKKSGINENKEKDERTDEQKWFDKRVQELELFSIENQLRALTINAAAGQEILKLPTQSEQSSNQKGSAVKRLFASFGGDPSLLDRQKNKE